jgi:hypothetical protein
MGGDQEEIRRGKRAGEPPCSGDMLYRTLTNMLIVRRYYQGYAILQGRRRLCAIHGIKRPLQEGRPRASTDP